MDRRLTKEDIGQLILKTSARIGVIKTLRDNNVQSDYSPFEQDEEIQYLSDINTALRTLFNETE